MMVGKTVYLAGIAHDLAYCGVMNVANAGEQMMLNLEIQPSNEPGDNFIIHCKIGSSFYLVHGPLCFDRFWIRFYNFEFRVLNNVSQLEHKS